MKGKNISMKVYPKTIYTDIVDMPTPMLVGITIHYFNFSDDNLYMKIFGSGPSPWSSNSVELGLLNSGASKYINLDNFLSRTIPVAATTEQITLTLRGYSDAGYSNLVHTFARDVTVIFIKSDDGSWTLDEDDDFDDGTVMGWAAEQLLGGGILTFVVAADFVLSPPWSAKMSCVNTTFVENSQRIYKSFTTPNRTTVYGIFNLRCSVTLSAAMYDLKIRSDAASIVSILTFVPATKWMRIVVPLTSNATIELDALFRTARSPPGSYNMYMWLDDFKIISKN